MIRIIFDARGGRRLCIFDILKVLACVPGRWGAWEWN